MGSTNLSSLTLLADTIKVNATVLDEYIARYHHIYPSLKVDGVSLSIASDDKEVLAARAALLSATRELRDVILGPVGILMNIGANEVLCLQTIHRYKIASSFGIHEQPSFETVSARCGLNVEDLRRILRYAMTDHIFCEPRPGTVAHTAISQVIAENPLMRDYVGNVCEVRFPASARTVDALQKYGKSQDPSQSGFSLCNNTARGLYDELPHNAEQARQWNGAMSALASQIDFDFILGGGCGDVSIGLGRHLPSAKFIVQDVSKTAREQGECISRELGAQVTFEAYDFRSPQPIYGADIYYFRNIFHNWPDKNCIEILRNQIPSLKNDARLVIDDYTLHEPGTLSTVEERRRRWMDINMLIFFGSHERRLEDWKMLLAAADPRFELVNVTRVLNQPNTILEVAFREFTQQKPVYDREL